MTDNDNRGLLRVIKVPIDVKAIFIGALGYIVYIAGGWFFDAVFEGIRTGHHVVSRFIYQWLSMAGLASQGVIRVPTNNPLVPFNVHSAWTVHIPLIGGEIQHILSALYPAPSVRPLAWWEMGLVALWFLIILTVFGGAICRVIAMRIARDESIGVGAALAYSLKNFRSYFLIPVFLAAVIAFFWGCILLAGLVCSIPWVGPTLLLIVLYPLVILASVIILLVAVGGLLGLFLMVAAVSTENNGTLDAISRAFSYVYVRPIPYFFYTFLVYVVAAIIVLVGVKIFLNIPWQAFESGAIANAAVANGVQNGALDAINLHLPTFHSSDFFVGAATLISWIFMIILNIGVLGFVATYVLGGNTAIYFALRKDVDGSEDSEIFVEGEEDEMDFGLPPTTPAAEAVSPETEEKKEEPEAAAETEKAEEKKPAPKKSEPAKSEAKSSEAKQEKKEEKKESESASKKSKSSSSKQGGKGTSKSKSGGKKSEEKETDGGKDGDEEDGGEKKSK